MKPVYIGVDVGTGSARVGVFAANGHLLAAASQPIRMWKPQPDFAEQSSADIWRSIIVSMRAALAKVPADIRICSLGFTATCSMVVLDRNGNALPVNPEGEAERNVIVWMDHRAKSQTDRLNMVESEIRRYVGGHISIEMQMPKLLWIKENLPETWASAGHFFDLPDFLTYRATGNVARSVCSLTCKWGYLEHEGRWDEQFLRNTGLADLADEGFQRIGTDIRQLGTLNDLLSQEAANELGLPAGIPVGVSTIDAHAGGIGTLGVDLNNAPINFNERLALIAGTSNCHMAVSKEARFIAGVWGPYHSALLPEFWLNEAGQSASGALIDHVLAAHPASQALRDAAASENVSIFDFLHRRLEVLTLDIPHAAMLTSDTHVDPDFHGNRSPRADASLTGMMTGLRLTSSIDDLARLYLATIQALAYGTRHIIETLNASGYSIKALLLSGGFTKNPIFLREHADACGVEIICPTENEAVLLGASMLGATASGAYADLPTAMAAMAQAGQSIRPNQHTKSYHDAKYQVFRRMYEDQMAYRQLMSRAIFDNQ